MDQQQRHQWQWKLHAYAHRFRGPVPNRSRTGTGPQPGSWGPLPYRQSFCTGESIQEYYNCVIGSSTKWLTHPLTKHPFSRRQLLRFLPDTFLALYDIPHLLTFFLGRNTYTINWEKCLTLFFLLYQIFLIQYFYNSQWTTSIVETFLMLSKHSYNLTNQFNYLLRPFGKINEDIPTEQC